MSGFKRKDPSKLQEQLQELTQSNDYGQKDENLWTLKTDNAGNGKAIIRFLPALPTDPNAVPFVKRYDHGFKFANGKWFIEPCPTTIGQKCPVCEANGELWGTNTEENKKTASERKRKLSYYANILVVKDFTNPDNNGRVCTYRFGQKIMDKILAEAKDDLDLGKKGRDVTCVFEGANFSLVATRKDKFINYDSSTFGNSAPIDGIDDEAFANELIGKMHDLNQYIKPEVFKSYEELEKRFKDGLGKRASTSAEDRLNGSVTQSQPQQNQFNQAMQEFEQNANVPTTGAMSDEVLQKILNGEL